MGQVLTDLSQLQTKNSPEVAQWRELFLAHAPEPETEQEFYDLIETRWRIAGVLPNKNILSGMMEQLDLDPSGLDVFIERQKKLINL